MQNFDLSTRPRDNMKVGETSTAMGIIYSHTVEIDENADLSKFEMTGNTHFALSRMVSNQQACGFEYM